MQPDEITAVLNRPLSQELLGRDVARLAYVAKDGTSRNVPLGQEGSPIGGGLGPRSLVHIHVQHYQAAPP